MQAIRANGVLALRPRRATGTMDPAKGSVLPMAADSGLERLSGQCDAVPGRCATPGMPPPVACAAETRAWEGREVVVGSAVGQRDRAVGGMG